MAAVGASVGNETYAGVTAALRAGLRWEGTRAAHGFFVECAVTDYAGVGPYTGGANQHCVGAGELTWGAARTSRFHLYGGLGLERYWQEHTEHQIGFDEGKAVSAVGIGASRRWLRADLETRIPLENFWGETRFTPQVQLTLGVAL